MNAVLCVLCVLCGEAVSARAGATPIWAGAGKCRIYFAPASRGLPAADATMPTATRAPEGPRGVSTEGAVRVPLRWTRFGSRISECGFDNRIGEKLGNRQQASGNSDGQTGCHFCDFWPMSLLAKELRRFRLGRKRPQPASSGLSRPQPRSAALSRPQLSPVGLSWPQPAPTWPWPAPFELRSLAAKPQAT